jgi:hypothetical protein
MTLAVQTGLAALGHARGRATHPAPALPLPAAAVSGQWLPRVGRSGQLTPWPAGL